jgi:hypothetical protein
VVRRRLIAAVATALTAAACGSAPSPSSSPSGSPVKSSRFSAQDFTTVIPTGWTDATTDQSAVAAINVGGTMLMLLIAPPTSANRSGEHIDVSTAAPEVPEDQLATYLQSASQNGATNLSAVQPFTLDGSTGLFITYTLTVGKAANKAQDMVIDHGTSTYEIVLNTAAADFSEQLHALQQVLDGWHWKP